MKFNNIKKLEKSYLIIISNLIEAYFHFICLKIKVNYCIILLKNCYFRYLCFKKAKII